MKQFTTFIPTFGVDSARAESAEQLLADLEAKFPNFKGLIEVREASEKPVIAPAFSEDDLI